MSRPSALPSPESRASSPAPTAPPAGPESTLQAPGPRGLGRRRDAARGLHHHRLGQPALGARLGEPRRGSGRAGGRGRRRSTVVEQRSYSRNCASTSCEAETWTSGQLARAAARRSRRSCAGLEVGEEQADRDRLGARRRASRRDEPLELVVVERLDHAVGADPLGAPRSAAPAAPAAPASARRGGRGWGGSGAPISSRSVKPAVATSAVRAPRSSSSALVPTVIPWAKPLDRAGLGAGALEHRLDRGDHPARLVVGRGRGLGRVQRSPVEEDGVGEGPADVDAEQHRRER